MLADDACAFVNTKIYWRDCPTKMKTKYKYPGKLSRT